MPSPTELRTLVQRYAETVSAGDPDAIAALFHPDAVQADPATAPPNVGRDAIRAFFAAAAGASNGTHFEATTTHSAGPFAAIDFAVTVQLETGTMSIEGIEVFEFDDDGLIRSVHAYWDEADVRVAS